VIALIPAAREARVVAETSEAFRQRFGRIPSVWATKAGAGVRAEPVARGKK
jgi:hypothetical protein